jgi:hypothetical protein
MEGKRKIDISKLFYKNILLKLELLKKKVNSKAKLLMQEFDEIKYSIIIIIEINQIKLSVVQSYEH